MCSSFHELVKKSSRFAPTKTIYSPRKKYCSPNFVYSQFGHLRNKDDFYVMIDYVSIISFKYFTFLCFFTVE